MSVLLFALFGLLVGIIARAMMRGKLGMGMLMTAALGMVGSLAGGSVAR